MSTIREIPAKIVFRDEDPVAVYIQNGTLKTYLLTEISFKNVEELHDVAPITNNNQE